MLWTIVIVVFLGLWVLSMILKIVPEYQRLVVFTLGRVSKEPKGPGVVILIPLVQRPVWVDLREVPLPIEQQTCITKDNAPIGIDFFVFLKVVDPIAAKLNIENYMVAANNIATTTLRAVVGDITLDDVLAKREQLNVVLREKLDEVTERWGVKVTSVEIKEIQPPKDVQDSMTKQMSAERNRRAMVTQADGQREAAIMVAEGEKQSNILRAEGERQAAILRAEANRQAAILNAEGYALALEKIFGAAKNVDAKTMSLQYLEALKQIGTSPSTKFVLPMEFTNLLRPLMNYTGKASEDK